MVAVIEATNVSTMGLGEFTLSGRPMTVVVLNGKQIANRESIDELVSLYSKTENALDGEPTWEDAAWQ